MNAERAALYAAMNEAADKAIDALGRYKFQMFGYHAAVWVSLNRILGGRRENPFQSLVRDARRLKRVNDAWKEAS